MHRIESPGRPTGWRRRFFRLPVPLFRAGLGWLFGGRLVLVEHRGRRTGRPRRSVVEVVARGRGTGAVTVASGFGGTADWYRNLRAHPQGVMRTGRKRIPVSAHAVPPERAAAIMVGYGRRHPRLTRRLARFMGFEVDGTDDDFAEVGRSVPFLELVPR
jgi:deazaflavin-dependent oxidoreductase (nitroreductase family)